MRLFTLTARAVISAIAIFTFAVRVVAGFFIRCFHNDFDL